MSRKSSGVAKAGLVTGIIGTSLAGVIASGLANNGCNGDGYGNGRSGGLLGGLFGGNRNCGPSTAWAVQSVYDQARMTEGAQAQTEVDMLTKYIMPLGHQVAHLQTEIAVNRERDLKNEVITGLLFKLADQKAENLFERANCCCEKNTIALTNAYAQLAAADQCNYDKLDAKIDCTYDKSTMRTDATFALRKAQVDAQIAQEMCGVVKGKPFLSPSQMADPYMGGQNIIASRQVVPVQTVSTFNTGDCGWNNGGWGTWGNGWNSWSW